MIRRTNEPVLDKILQDLQKQIDELKKSVNSPMQKDGSHFRGKDGDMRFLKGANKKGYLEVYTADGVYTTVSDVFQLESRERMLPVFDEPTLTDGDIIAGRVRSTTSMTYARGIAGTEAGYWLGKYGTSDYRLFIGSSASKYFAYDNTDIKLVGGSVTAGAVKSSTTMTYDRAVAGTEFGYWLGYYGANDYRLFIGSSATKQFKYDNTDLTFLGGTITGGTIQTATTGQRVVIDGATNTIKFYDTDGVLRGSLYGNTSYLYTDTYFDCIGLRTSGTVEARDSYMSAYLGFRVGTLFNVDASGNITKINNITYSFPSVAPTLNQILKCTNATGGVLTWSDDSSSGTVTSVSVVTANGFAGTVATATTTPAITLTTSITGLLKGNGTAISAASAGTDYVTPTGSGAGLTSLNATNISSGTLADGILSSNVPLKNGSNVFSNVNYFANTTFLGQTNTTNGLLSFYNGSNAFITSLSAPLTATSDKAISLPNISGTLALVDADNTKYLHGSRSGLGSTGFGVKGSVTSTSGSSYSIYGIYGEATGTAGVLAIGVYGTASGGVANWAGYFQGDVYSSGTITAGTFSGNLTGNVTGNVSGSSGSCTGNAATVTNGVYTSRTLTINGTTQDLSANRSWTVGDAIKASSNVFTNVNYFTNTTLLGQATTTNGLLSFYNSTNSFVTSLSAPSATADRAITLPNAAGTVALTSDLSSYAALAGNNALSGNNTTTGSVMLDGELENTPTSDANLSVSGKNTVIFFMNDVAYTITLTSPTDGQFLFVSNDKDSIDNVILTPVINGTNTTLTLAKGKSVTLRYRSSESTWYSTGQ